MQNMTHSAFQELLLDVWVDGCQTVASYQNYGSLGIFAKKLIVMSRAHVTQAMTSPLAKRNATT